MSDLRSIKLKAKGEFLSDCCDDEQPEGLWKLLWIIRYLLNDEEYPTADKDRSNPEVVHRLAIEIIRELLEQGAVQASFTNYPVTDSYRPERCTIPVGDTVLRIEREWAALGREPSMCEIVEFICLKMPSAGAPASPRPSHPHRSDT